MSYCHLSSIEREEIAYLLALGNSQRAIGRKINRTHTTIAREIKRNKPIWEARYYAFWADFRAEARKISSRTHARLKNYKTRNYVKQKLTLGWSPQVISGRLNRLGTYPTVSHEAIYQWIYTEGVAFIDCLARGHRRRLSKSSYRKAKRSSIPNRISITERPEAINQRAEIGHWESDSMVSSQSKAALNVLVERTSRLVRMTPLLDKSATQTCEAITQRLCRYPGRLRQSVTYDNGTENAYHEKINTRLKAQSYFCLPYHSWEKGTVEQTNGLIRRFLPKKTDFANINEKQIKRIEKLLNNRPRKCLEYQTPYEAFRGLSGALSG